MFFHETIHEATLSHTIQFRADHCIYVDAVVPASPPCTAYFADENTEMADQVQHHYTIKEMFSQDFTISFVVLLPRIIVVIVECCQFTIHIPFQITTYSILKKYEMIHH